MSGMQIDLSCIYLHESGAPDSYAREMVCVSAPYACVYRTPDADRMPYAADDFHPPKAEDVNHLHELQMSSKRKKGD